MPLFDSLTRFRQLKSVDRRIVLEAWVALPTIHFLLCLLGFKRTLALLSQVGSRKSATPASEWNPRAWHIMRLTRLAARRGVVQGNCLSQSLTLWWLLHQSGIESELRVGVRKEANQFLAHAWIELAGFPLNDRVEAVRQYAMFEKLTIPNLVEWA